jgi:hypothetical protein
MGFELAMAAAATMRTRRADGRLTLSGGAVCRGGQLSGGW